MFDNSAIDSAKQNKGVDIVIAISIFMFTFLPQSRHGVIFGLNFVIAIWVISALFIVVLTLNNPVDIRKVLVGLFTLTYLLIASLISIKLFGSYFSLARFAPCVCLLLLLSIDFNSFSKNAYILANLFVIILIAWNICIVIGFSPIIEFTMNNYSQYYERALYYSIELRHKPVMTFGIHTYASFFYMALFYYYYARVKAFRKIWDIVVCILLTGFTLLLYSNTSLIYSIVMIALLINLFKEKKGIIVIIGVVGVIFVFFNIDTLIDQYINTVSSKGNGFIARYFGDSTVFQGNWTVIFNSLGLGFTIAPETMQVGYSDSGWIVYMTMGSIPFVVAIYSLLIVSIKNNFSKAYRIPIALIILSFEVALPATFQMRFIFFYVFYIFLFASLDNEINNQTNSIEVSKNK